MIKVVNMAQKCPWVVLTDYYCVCTELSAPDVALKFSFHRHQVGKIGLFIPLGNL